MNSALLGAGTGTSPGSESDPKAVSGATIPAVDSAPVAVRATRYARMGVAVGVLAVIALVAAPVARPPEAFRSSPWHRRLLGAPLVAIVKVICDRVESLKPAGELLGR